MHPSIAEKAAVAALFLAVLLLPASYVLSAVRALRSGRLEVSGRGVNVCILRSEQPGRFAFTTWGLLLSMSLLAALCCGFAMLVLVSA